MVFGIQNILLLKDPEEIKKWVGTNTLPFYVRNKKVEVLK
jgi:hypothetical protein